MKPTFSTEQAVSEISNYILGLELVPSDNPISRDKFNAAIEQVRATLNSVVVRNPNTKDYFITHYGTCRSCDLPNRLYLLSFIGRDDSWDKLECLSCMVYALRWDLGERNLENYRLSFRWSGFANDLMKKFLEPLLPETQGERDKCDMCEIIMLTEDDERTYHKWAKTPAMAKGKEVSVHYNCTFVCDPAYGCGTRYACDVRNPNGIDSTGHYAQHYSNRVICELCLDTLIDNDEARSCDNCGNYHNTDNMYWFDHDQYCSTCYRGMWRNCEDCDSEYQPYRGNHECHRGIHHYGHKPKPIFHGTSPYHFGIELEVEQIDCDYSIDNGITIVESGLGTRAYMKEDGSLENGFEIVTHPHSLEEFQSKVDWKFLADLRYEGFRSWDTSSCGLHVHISRKAFKDENHLVRFTKLIYDNKNAVRSIAGRSSDYARFNDEKKLIGKIKGGIDADGHCSAVNVENEHTVEVRVFRGSLNKTRILSAIEFCHAAVEHTRNMKVTPKDRPFAWTKFMSFVVNESVRNPNKYNNLNEIMESVANTPFRANNSSQESN